MVLPWTKRHPNDPITPEALNYLVRATRYACSTNPETSKYSREAYTLLHERYKGNKWTKQTPFWF